jgi:VWFA-related protein
MWGREFRSVILAVALLLATSLHPQIAQNTATTITSSTELVLIPTVVNDKSGSHISGLRREDFVLKQDGKSQPIAIFEEVKTNVTRVRRSEGEQGTFSNIEPGAADYHRLSIIVLDFVNTPFVDQSNARSELFKFLSQVAESGEPMCLLELSTGGITLLHDFTDDPKVLATAIRKAQANATTLVHEQVVDPHHPVGDALAAALTRLIQGAIAS